jgi:TetR/AcrR family transcriptional regulator of autoinduction and epiphytic fitness
VPELGTTGSAVASSGLDGRQSRTARSRLAICEACLDLIQEGELQPSADQIATRAGRSRRSIFNHFADLAELYDAVHEVGMARYASLLVEISTDLPVSERVAQLVTARSNFLEATAAFTRALTAQALVGSAPDQAMRVARAGVQRQHDEVERLFEAELLALPAAERVEVLEAMSGSLSALQWEFLRSTRRLSQKRAKVLVQRTLQAILRDSCAAT